MYPYITLFWTQFHMTGIGTILFIVCFIQAVAYYAKQYGLSTKKFFTYIPLYLIGIYIVAAYIRFLFGEFIVIPTTLRQVALYLSPHEYTFHLVGIVLGVWAMVFHFLSQTNNKKHHVQRIDVLFLSALLSMIPYGVFLLLWDTFIWSPINSWIRVSALVPESNVATYDTVIPLGLYLSLGCAILALGIKTIRARNPWIQWFWFVWRAVFLMLLCVLILYQEYPRHLVSWFLWKTRDIKNYVLIASACVVLFYRQTNYKEYTNLTSNLSTQ